MKNYRALSEEEARDYAKSIPSLFSANAQLSSHEIGDGNLNLVFHIRDQTSGKSIIFKQALPYARVVGESWPLTLDRSRIEKEALVIQQQLCPTLVPVVYHYDAELALTIMEDLSDHTILRKGLIEGNQYPLLAEHVGVFIARTLFFNSDFYLSAAQKKKQVVQFSNPELCKITEDLVFTDPYYDAPTNDYNPLIQQDVEQIWTDAPLKAEIAKLKYTFLTSAQSLIHGDLHTGSIFVTAESTKVIDPEFAYYGPIGFDIGAVIANLLLNYVSQEAHLRNSSRKAQFQHYLLETVDKLWMVFEDQFKQLILTEGKEPSFQDPTFITSFLAKIKADALGFAGCKMLRRVIGLAGVADLQSISTPELRAACEREALHIGRLLILNRQSWADSAKISSYIQESLAQWRNKSP